MLVFQAVLERPEAVGSWTFMQVPFSVEEKFGTKSQVRVKGTVNGVSYRSSLMPNGDGSHYMVVNKDIRDQAGVTQGDTVQVTMELDTEAREAIAPDDFQSVLDLDEAARLAFDKMAYSHKKEYINWIEEAKKAETRASRIEKAIVKLQQGIRLK
ncbi:MAG: hypothetical protein K0Q81_1503 [Paenibacillus sp.]|jgi:hypothetical protein|nr:hypothetical protein [Paenibacillus sp.]